MKRFFRNVSIYLLVLISIMYMIKLWDNNPSDIEDFTITSMVESIENNEVSEIVMEGREIIGKKSAGGENEYFRAYVPEIMTNNFYDNYLKEKVDNKEIRFVAKEKPGPSFLASMLPTIITILILGGIWYMFMQRTQGGGNKMMSFGKSKAKKMQPDDTEKITFDQVAGLEEEKEELAEIVDFLKAPKKYMDIGARIPKGVLLVGPPGTGKTYLSRAVSGEADVPFFTISGSDFVEMFVGVGASRVRDLFEEAKKNAPCIIFIDEIDAVGRRRGAGLGGGHDEREQTLNQLLVEMDGFEKNEGVIVMAATNRADILDPAILRPGRFDRNIYVGHPDVRGREAILEVHTRNKPLAEDVDLEIIAKSTPGFTPADLENLVNEAAILSARHDLLEIPMEIIKEASIKVQAGPEKKSRFVSEKERNITAYHEAGHAIASRATPGSDPVNMITIVPRGGAGGFTAYLPEDRSYMTKKRMQGQLISLLGGRAAEEIILDDISTGASNDLERATTIATKMVKTYGMSDKLGVMTYEDDGNGDVFVGMDIGSTKAYSEEVAFEIDKEIRSFIDNAYNDSKDILKENIDALHRVAKTLLEKETIHGPEFEALFLGEEFVEEDENIETEKEVDVEVNNKEESKESNEKDIDEEIEE